MSKKLIKFVVPICRSASGFSLVELSVAMAIGAVGTAALFVMISQYMKTTARVTAVEQTRMRQMEVLQRIQRYTAGVLRIPTSSIYGVNLYPPEIGGSNPSPGVWVGTNPCRGVLIHRKSKSPTTGADRYESIILQTLCPTGINIAASDEPILPGLRCYNPVVRLEIDSDRPLNFSTWNPRVRQTYTNMAMCVTQNPTPILNDASLLRWIRIRVGSSRVLASGSMVASRGEKQGVVQVERVIEIIPPDSRVEFLPPR